MAHVRRDELERQIAEKSAEVAHFEEEADAFDRLGELELRVGYREKAAESQRELEALIAQAGGPGTPSERLKAALTDVVRTSNTRVIRLADRMVSTLEDQRRATGRPIGMRDPSASTGPTPVHLMSNEQKASYYERTARSVSDPVLSGSYREKAAEARKAAQEEGVRRP
jgi:hypothetical protein